MTAVLPTGFPDIPATHRPLLFAHRGSTLLAPENTVAAFDLALAHQADVLETDVRLSRDGRVMVTHDADVDRTTNGNGKVRDHTRQELQRLDAGYRFMDLKGRRFRGLGLKLLTLDELFERYPQTPINIDIKDKDTRAADAVAEVLARHADHPWTNVGSFHGFVLRHFRAQAPRCSTAAIQEEVARLYFDRSLSLWMPPLPVPLPYRYLQIPVRYYGLPLTTSAFIQRTQACGVKVVYWTINDPTHMQQLALRGVDGLVTDRIDLAEEVLRGR